ncbi:MULTISPECIES: LLM class oxidoreductase [Thermoactinomyces]|jgi:luciferase-type oxidoreductase|uniref:LLM class oxidoreductase n=1 Tax=Thermoactinomyces daqus TaxID=1329516 RepID=A0A7W1XB02_9BACL|nr:MULTISPECIES: LLM class oxidoreductase [Thermoactinomyces]MBA4543277.1 LLM class oxidoreductase [Thermoactinomyces daqus]MBH8599569.1 LLM class oxidoreductase [Thermoactinomyces sp. CICC 10523]MBH8605702.1 LLM class oxidoreductase [Thermoactinomyces sp. CICC 10522]MBH8608898.1 LLM class oxidoreductase [Thermoactinomyces sp. CICC 10521]
MGFSALRKMIPANRLTLGVELPLDTDWSPEGLKQAKKEGRPFGVPNMERHAEFARLVDRLGFKSMWIRDVPFFDPHRFGDAAQLFDPFAYLGYLAAITHDVILATGAIVLPLRHPYHVAKAAATVDQLSGGRFVMGIATGDRPVEFPIFGVDADQKGAILREHVELIKEAWNKDHMLFDNQLDLLPKPVQPEIPIVMAGRGTQTLEWIVQHLDGWFNYPRGVASTELQIEEWEKVHEKLGITERKPYISAYHLDLHEHPYHPAKPFKFGATIGRNELIRHLKRLEEIGVNHIALHFRHSQRPIPEVLHELAEYVLPEFNHTGND